MREFPPCVEDGWRPSHIEAANAETIAKTPGGVKGRNSLSHLSQEHRSESTHDGALDEGGLHILGVELYELFSGCSPFDGDEAIRSGNEMEKIDCLSHSGSGTISNGSINEPLPVLLLGDENGTRSSTGTESTEVESSQGTKKRVLGYCRFGTQQRRRKYVPLSELGLPSALCHLVSSLLDTAQKDAGDGDCIPYSSVDEVEEDLRFMINDPDRFLFDIQVGTKESGDCHRLNLSADFLFGRDQEVSELLAAFDRIAASRVKAGPTNNEIVFLSGYSGTGKSSIVHRARERFIAGGAHFISGKFDAMRKAHPLSAIVSALNEYCQLLTDLDEERLNAVQKSATAALGGEGNVLVDLIPNLGKIIGRTDKPTVQVGGRAAQRRLAFLFRKFFRSTSAVLPSHPIVFFLENMQWADEASLQLLNAVSTDDEICALLVVATYRDNEVGPDHPLTASITDMIQSKKVVISSIPVGNMDSNSINSLISHSLQMLPRRTRSLADVIQHKTGGNALFVTELLQSLLDAGLLSFSLSMRQWQWDLDRIRAREIADNVVGLMRTKLLRLAPEIHNAIRVAAAFGSVCQEELLHILDRGNAFSSSTMNREATCIANLLYVVVSEGLMTFNCSAFRFSHDQIHNAAYLLIPEVEREAFHLMVGQCLWQNASAEELDTYLFVVVDQIFRGSHLIADKSEKLDIAKLCLKAGQKASKIPAFLPACVYLKAGISLLDDDDWTNSNRSVCLDLFNSCAETEYILADFVGMKTHLECVLERARTLKEKLRAYYCLVQSLGAQGKSNEAINTGILVLNELGEEFPLNPTEVEVRQEMMMTQALLQNASDTELLQLDVIKDPNKRETMRFLNAMSLWMFLDKKHYHTLLICRMVRLSILHGVCRESTISFALYGGCLLCAMGEYQKGYRFGKLSISLLERFQCKEFYSRVMGTCNGFINISAEPIQSCLPGHKNAIEVGLLTGDTEFAMVNAQLYLGTSLYTGQLLRPLLKETEIYSKQMVEYGHLKMNKLVTILEQVVLYLLGAEQSRHAVNVLEERVDQKNLAMSMKEATMVLSYRLWLAYLFGKYTNAAKIAEMNSGMETFPRPRFITICYHFFIKGLNAIELARISREDKWISIADRAIEEMTAMAKCSSWNCQNKLELMKAEYAYLEGNIVEASKLYDRAVELASNHRFIHEEALALERAGIFHLENHDHDVASGYFSRACQCYDQWGACRKADQVREHYL